MQDNVILENLKLSLEKNLLTFKFKNNSKVIMKANLQNKQEYLNILTKVFCLSVKITLITETIN